ncbi:DUF5711 family protein [Cellulosilyticum sp. I15G10I2]|uniref:DUF5711 family protein n=1 Tax=Cellulosilyticum sp. I15G10I2 TaxID=1892843 RepID=UPI00085C80A6|nr:DUF5711 family protein [Cellulosilyticum sp. I15G10I2]
MSRLKSKRALGQVVSVLIMIVIIIVTYLLFVRGSLVDTPKNYTVLEQEKELIQLDILSATYVGINNKQLIKVTENGIVAYDFDGEELWSDTLTLDNYIVRQREPYIAIANKMGNTITIFSDKGKQGEVVCQNPIAYFSINKNGSVAVIENLGDSHIVSAYDEKGNSLGVQRVSHVKAKNTGYPAAAEVSPNNELLLTSYIDVDNPVLTSNLLAIQIQKPKEEKIDNSLYGIEQKDNFIYEIEFIKDNEWVSIGDKWMTWYTMSGQEIARQENVLAYFSPYIVKASSYGDGFLPIISAKDLNKSTIHKQNELSYFNAKGEMFFNLKLDEPVTYFYANDKGVVLGQRNFFMGYNKMGIKLFEFNTSLDVSKVFYLPDRKAGIAVTKDKVILLKPKKERK